MPKLSPKDVQRLEAARSAYLQNQVEIAVVRYEALLKKYPEHCPTVAELAQIYLRLGRLKRAEPLLDRLLQIGSGDLNSLIVAERGFRQLGGYRKAMDALNLALAQKPLSQVEFQIRARRLELAERLNQLETARVDSERLRQLNPEHFQTQFLNGKISRRCHQLDEADRYLRLALGHPNLSFEELSLAAYELAGVLDRKSQFRESYEILAKAKKLEHASLGPERIKAAWMADLITGVTDEMNHGARPSIQRSRDRSCLFGRPLCFLTGHPRSGTTLVEQLLAAHPGIATADESSALFHSIAYPLVFPTEQTSNGTSKNPLPILKLHNLNVEQVPRSTLKNHIDQYRAQLEWLASDTNSDHYLIDKNPGGLIDLPIIESALPQTKVVVVLRDPRDICISCFQQFLGVNLISVNFNTLENTAAKIVRDLQFWLAFRAVTALDWIEVYYENLVTNPEAELRSLYEFLQLEWHASALAFQTTLSDREVHSPTYSQVAEPITDRSVGRWKNYCEFMQPALPILEPICQALNYET
jgi:hypothetical protein